MKLERHNTSSQVTAYEIDTSSMRFEIIAGRESQKHEHHLDYGKEGKKMGYENGKIFDLIPRPSDNIFTENEYGLHIVLFYSRITLFQFMRDLIHRNESGYVFAENEGAIRYNSNTADYISPALARRKIKAGTAKKYGRVVDYYIFLEG